jgi:hypothetical protein
MRRVNHLYSLSQLSLEDKPFVELDLLTILLKLLFYFPQEFLPVFVRFATSIRRKKIWVRLTL